MHRIAHKYELVCQDEFSNDVAAKFIFLEYCMYNELNTHEAFEIARNANDTLRTDTENKAEKFLSEQFTDLKWRWVMQLDPDYILNSIVADYNKNEELKSTLTKIIAESKVDITPGLRVLKFWDLENVNLNAQNMQIFVNILGTCSMRIFYDSDFKNKSVLFPITVYALTDKIPDENFMGKIPEDAFVDDKIDDLKSSLIQFVHLCYGETIRRSFEYLGFVINDKQLKRITEFNLMSKFRLMKILEVAERTKPYEDFLSDAIRFATLCTDKESYIIAVNIIFALCGDQPMIEIDHRLTLYSQANPDTGTTQFLNELYEKNQQSEETGGFGFNWKLIVFLIVLLLFLSILYKFASGVSSGTGKDYL